MRAEDFVTRLQEIGIDTLIGVPDSTLKQLCDYINTDGKDRMRHYVSANEGAAVGIAMGEYLSTGKPACVYMQNSGLGNTVNPVTSLAHEDVYGIPMLFIIGWRGEPGVHDEPQHKFMGKVTGELLELLDIPYEMVGVDTTDAELRVILNRAKIEMADGRQFAVIAKKGTFEQRNSKGYENPYTLVREEVIAQILRKLQKEDVVVSTTGKISREVYEQADIIYEQHGQDFLTVGGMGHASMIAFGIAQRQKEKRIYCIDGDGAVLMHMGALAFLGKEKPGNLVHICLNNDAHESVGGMPTGAAGVSYAGIAKECGYPRVYTVKNMTELEYVLKEVKSVNELCFVEVQVALSSREDLGRPGETARENKLSFMKYHAAKRQ